MPFITELYILNHVHPFGPVQNNLDTSKMIFERIQNSFGQIRRRTRYMTQWVYKAETIYFSLVAPLFDVTLQFRPSLVIVQLWSQARLWACGRGDMSTPSFGSHINPISTRGGGQIMPTPYWCPHQVLKAWIITQCCAGRRSELNSATFLFRILFILLNCWRQWWN